MANRLNIVYDNASESFYWAFHSNDFILESKKNYKNSKVCEASARKFLLGGKLEDAIGRLVKAKIQNIG